MPPTPTLLTPWESHILLTSPNPLPHLHTRLKTLTLNPNTSFSGSHLLTTAITLHSLPLVKLLLNHGADPNIKSNLNGKFEPPIITAVRVKCSIEILIEIIKFGGKTNLNNFYGESPIFQSISSNAIPHLNYLLSTLPHSTCTHPHPSTCPFKYALKLAPKYKYKRESLIILLKHQYSCTCKINNPDSFYKYIENKYELNIKNVELVKMIYLTTAEKVRIKNVDVVDEGCFLDLKNLARIEIRKNIAKSAVLKKSVFINDLQMLPLPFGLIKFLMVD